jgi:hypothetical protein
MTGRSRTTAGAAWRAARSGAVLWGLLAPLSAGALTAAAAPEPVPTLGRPSLPRSVSGMLLVARGERIVIDRVNPGSLAAQAGLLQGDILLVVNDLNLIDLAPLSPDRVIEMIDTRRGEEVRLVVGRGGGTLTVAIPWEPAAPGRPAAPSAPLVVGGTAPPFEGRALGGGDVSLASLRGTPVLLYFWASWCAPCRDAAITLRRLADQNGDRLTWRRRHSRPSSTTTISPGGRYTMAARPVPSPALTASTSPASPTPC